MKGKHFVQVFFVLRKKDNQVTFLHLYHHTMVVLTVWVLAKFVPGTVKPAKSWPSVAQLQRGQLIDKNEDLTYLMSK
jgi:hypothetical protein